jgi:hypothetical protein
MENANVRSNNLICGTHKLEEECGPSNVRTPLEMRNRLISLAGTGTTSWRQTILIRLVLL